MSQNAPPAERRLLIVSYHFADGSTGGFRWDALARGLAQRGWLVDVITASPATAGHAVATVHSVAAPRWPVRLADGAVRLWRFLSGRRTASPDRSSTAVPPPPPAPPETLHQEAESLPVWHRGRRLPTRQLLAKTFDGVIQIATTWHWSARASRLGTALVRRHGHAAVIVSAPPHMTQRAGASIARRTGVPYVADYRDAWGYGTREFDGFSSPAVDVFSRLMQRRTERAASAAVHNSDVALERSVAEPRLPAITRLCIPNAYDDQPTSAAPDATVFRILFSGWIYDFMDPRVLFRAVRDFRRESGVDATTLKLELIGVSTAYMGMPMRAMAQAYDVADCTDISPRVSREDARRAQERAAVLVAFDCPHPLAVPMKFYDYVLNRGDLLMISEPGSALDRVARKVGAAAVSPDDPDGLVAALSRAYQRWQTGDYTAVRDPERLFHRDRTVEAFVQLLDSFARR